MQRVLVITGAGISAESGIPTFRGKDGYWRNLDPVSLATPEAFARDPQLVWAWYRERREGTRAAQPNPAHAAVVMLAAAATEFLLVTQNVDDLHARAGLFPGKIVQIHGDIFVTRCSQCDYVIDNHKAQKDEVPVCPACAALMRPGVVWFGEQLDSPKIARVEEFLERGATDLTIVIGTTAVFGYILDWGTRPSRQLVEINPEETPLSPRADRCFREPAGVALPRLVKEWTGA
jgi:NAD-dependent deacetylase